MMMIQAFRLCALRGWILLLFILHVLVLLPSTNSFSWTSVQLQQQPATVPFLHRYTVTATASVTATALHSAVDSSQSPSTTPNTPSYTVRNCQYFELAAVADIIMASFYQNSTSPFKSLYRIAELNRLQQNFPYADSSRHVMLVATCSETKEVVAFCDVDARPPSRPTDPPRPYLSDLAVSPTYRRRGIAKLLIQTSEGMARTQMKKQDLYIKVEDSNVVAVQMYDALGYEELGHTFGSNGMPESTILLRKNLLDGI